MKGPVIHIFCVRELGYSESSAQRRIVACRVLKDIPEIEKKIENGDLSLTNISKVNQFFKEADLDTKKEVLKQVEGLSKEECEIKLFQMTGKDEKAKETKKRMNENTVKVSIVLSNETLELMEKVKSLLGKKMTSEELIQFMAGAAMEKIERKKFKQVMKPKKTLPPAEAGRMNIVPEVFRIRRREPGFPGS